MAFKRFVTGANSLKDVHLLLYRGENWALTLLHNDKLMMHGTGVNIIIIKLLIRESGHVLLKKFYEKQEATALP